MIYRIASGYSDSLLILPAEIIGTIDSVGETEIKILLCAAEFLSKSGLEEEDLISLLSERFSRDEILSALAFWRGAGILRNDGKTKTSGAPRTTVQKQQAEPNTAAELAQKGAKVDADELPFYSSKELGEAAEKNSDFKNLVSFAEKRLGKVLNTSELARLYAFVDYIKLPVNVIMLSVEDCCSRGKSSLRYITKQLIDFADNGIDSYEKAEALFVRRRESQSYENYVRTLFGIGERKLVPKEKAALENWRSEWHFERAMLDLAYEKTVSSAKKPSILYMNKILEKWHEDGFSTPEEVQSGAKPSDSGAAPKSYDLQEFFEAAVTKGRKNI